MVKEDLLTKLREYEERISPKSPEYNFKSAQIYLELIKEEIREARGFDYGERKLKELIEFGVKEGIYGEYLLDWKEDEIRELNGALDFKRDSQWTYAGIKILSDRYLARTLEGKLFEGPQEMYMLIAMTLALKEKDRVCWAKKFYEKLSKFEVSLATPILLNARRKFRQLSSCFVLSVDDDLTDIFDNVFKASQIAKFSGGLGIYVGKIRSTGTEIQTVKGASSGVIPVVRIFNDVMTYVDQLGMRKGSASITLDLWHPDVLDFLQIKTNVGEERKKAHDVHPALSVPDLFMERLKKKQDWTLIDPYEARKFLLERVFAKRFEELTGVKVKGIRKVHHSNYYDFVLELSGEVKKQIKERLFYDYKLEGNKLYVKALDLSDFYGEEFNRFYELLEREIPKRKINSFELMKMILNTIFETGEPFIFFRDRANELNPNKHVGVVYSSNLCMEIVQNTSCSRHLSKEVQDGVSERKKLLGDVVVCNLGALNLGKVEDYEGTLRVLVRMLDNVIDLNFYPIEEAQRTNKLYRAIGVGVLNYHYLLVKRGIRWESEEHLKFADELFEKIAFYTLKASLELAKERGAYPYFKGSDWERGIWFGRRVEEMGPRWKELYKEVKRFGLRNGYLLALMPTGSTSIIVGATPSIDPIFDRFYKEENMSGILPVLPPEIDKYFWHYKGAYEIDQEWIIRAGAVRQRWIDQSQSLNLFIDPRKIDGPTLLKYYQMAWELGLKTVYYLRSKSMSDISDCEICSL